MFAGARPKGLIIGLAGCALLGWALFTVFTTASCTGTAVLRGCNTDPGGAVALAIPAGIILGIVGIFMGGGPVIFAGIFLSVGLSALIPTILGLMPDMQLFGWLFGGIFFVCGLLPFIGGALLGKSFLAKQKLAAELMQSGVKGIGTIVEVRDTGTTINDDPKVVIRMRIAPLDGSAPVERSKTVTVPRIAIPRAGERYPAWFDYNDPDKWMFGTGMDENAPAEVKEMFARAAADGDGDEDRAEPSPVEELARLSVLWKDGALTDREFADAKARLLPKIGR